MKQNIGTALQKEKRSKNRKIAFIVVLCTFLIGLISATQIFAHSLNYQIALGFNIYHVYPPWNIINWYIKWGFHTEMKTHFLLANSVGSSVIVVFLLIFSVVKLMRSRKVTANESLHGSARWAIKDDIKKAALLNDKGVFIGAWIDEQGKTYYLRHDGPEHILCYAPTRSGKGVGLVLPTLLTWPESAVITDLKGELWAITSGWRKNHANNKVIRFEPAFNGSAAWNPLDEIRIGTDYETGDVQNLATLLVDPDGKGLSDHWLKTAQALLVGCIMHLIYKRELDGTQANLAALDGMLADPSRPVSELWEEMTTTLHCDGLVHPVVARSAKDMLDRPDEEAGSVLSTTKSVLSLYRDPIVANNTSHSDFRIYDLMNHDVPVSLYIVTEPVDKDRLRPLVRVLVNMIIKLQATKMEFIQDEKGGVRAKGNYKFKQLLMLDEFIALGKLKILQEALAFIAGYGMKAYLIVQDRNQLTDRETGYGPDETISSNAHIQIAFAPNRVETAEYISKLVGQATVVKESIQTSGKSAGLFLGNVSRSMQEVQRPLLTPDEALRLPGSIKDSSGMISKPGDMLIMIAGMPAIYGIQPLYFQDEILTARSACLPPEDTDVTVVYCEPEERIHLGEAA